MTTHESAQVKTNRQQADRLLTTRRRRHYYDLFASKLIAFSGIGVIITISLIFVYLLKEVVPLFQSASVNQIAEYKIPQLQGTTPLHWAMDERGRSALRIDSSGRALFLETQSGAVLDTLTLPIGGNRTVTAFALDSDESGVFALGLDDGSIVVAQYLWQTDFLAATSERVASARLVALFEVATPSGNGISVSDLAVRQLGDRFLLAATYSDMSFQFVELTNPDQTGPAGSGEIDQRAALNAAIASLGSLFIDGDGRFLIHVADTGVATIYDIAQSLSRQSLQVAARAELSDSDTGIADVSFLVGELSLLVATDSGALMQWFVVRRGETVELVRIRDFELADAPIAAVASEQRRKNFAAADSTGNLALYNATAHNRLFKDSLFNARPTAVVLSPRGTRLIAELSDSSVSYWAVDNPHPEVSFAALWNRVWYESYPEPDYVWQSSSASNDFEPKYSLVPLSFGTLKAAFYAMLFASPLAICAAIYTGYFMTPALRRSVKPMIELMEALPTVVLGFLAGLWLAPFVESNLLGILSLLVFMPLGICISSFVWFCAPKKFRLWLSDGWEAILLVPVIILIGFVSLALGEPLEAVFFDGNLQSFLSDQYGINYSERNAMIVGFAMGFAVIPSVYSIAEDAIFSVPKHLSDGSLALGATAWQSLFYVVLPMASPGIFSALMIGLGRAVGETMIVLMVTGNTPIIDINMFDGMRTLAANIAIEVPESEVGSSHYRILFLAAMCLFLFTFVVNTVAEVVRQRLRRKYINL